MKLVSLSLRIRTVIALFLGVTISFAPLLKAEALPNPSEDISAYDKTRFLSLGSFIESWNQVEHAIVTNFYSLMHYFEDFFHFSQTNAPKFNYDVTLVGFVNECDGIGRHPILFKDCFGAQIKSNFISTRNIPANIEDAQLGLPRLDPASPQNIGAVAILTDILADKAVCPYKRVPNSLIKVAYTMFEATEIPCNWAKILNSDFDMAVVPDPFLVEVYKTCGVTIPVFVLPLPLVLQDFLSIKQRPAPHKQFTFGMSGGFWERKNHMRVLDAFAAEFGNNPDVKLKLHGRFGEKELIQKLAEKISEYNLTNVELIVYPYDRTEYLDFFKSLDCYVFLSKGEGFSITPREALACGKPCILTNNTAQMTICNSGSVRVVRSDIPVPALYDCHYTNYGCGYTQPFVSCLIEEIIELLWKPGAVGYQFDCTVEDAREAMRDVYENYTCYRAKAKEGREWVQRYLYENLSRRYISLVKPTSIVLGEDNIIGDTFLMTNSKALYEKYQYLLGK